MMLEKIEYFIGLYSDDAIQTYFIEKGTFRVNSFIFKIKNSIDFDCFVGFLTKKLTYKVYD